VIQRNKPGSIEDHQTQKQGTRIPEAFRRILQVTGNHEAAATNSTTKPNEMSLKVTTRPNPFFTTVTLDITCDQNKHVIVRMFDEAGKIIKMLSWYVMKGSNVTSISDLNILSNGQYFLDIIDTEGTVLFNTTLSKQ
jgi:hypothetical protein